MSQQLGARERSQRCSHRGVEHVSGLWNTPSTKNSVSRLMSPHFPPCRSPFHTKHLKSELDGEGGEDKLQFWGVPG